MTSPQLILFTGLALVLTVVAAILTRATPRRILGALAGAAVWGPVMLAIIHFCQKTGWWHMSLPWEPKFLTLLCISAALCGYPFLITWRIARRFGARGLIVSLCIIAIAGPLRD